MENFRHSLATTRILTSATFARYTDPRFRMRVCIRTCIHIRLHTRARKIARIVRYTLRIQTIPPIRSLLCKNSGPAPLPPLLSSRFASAGRSVVMDVKRMRLGPFFILYMPIHIYTRDRGMPRSKRAFVAIYFARENGNGIASTARPRARIVFRRCKWASRQIYMVLYIYVYKRQEL